MTPQELFNAFLAGKNLGTITRQQARALLDMARGKLLARGRKITGNEASDNLEITKSKLAEAHQQLTGLPAVYAQAAGVPISTVAQCELALARLKAARLAADKCKKAAPTASAPTPAPTPARPAPAPRGPTAREIAVELLALQTAKDAADLIKTRAELNQMTAAQASAFFKAGGTLIA